MTSRTDWIPISAFALAGMGAAFAGLTFARITNVHAGWLLAAGAAVLGVMGFLTYEERRERKREAARWVQRADVLQQQIDRQRQAIDTLADGLEVAIFISDAKGNLEYGNREARNMFRLDQADGKSLVAATLSHDLLTLATTAASTDIPQHAELTLTYPEDRIVIAKAWASSATRVFISLVEITELRRLERVRRDFVANVSHEMRTPMTIIRAMAETMQEDEDPDLRKRYLDKIISEVDRLSLISQDLLVLSASESNPVRKQECDLGDITHSVTGQLGRLAEDKGLALTYEGPNHLTIAANPTQITQVVLNLVENAINYTVAGSVRVELAKNADNAVLKVTDTGIGIANEHVPRIFERFYRVDKARSRSTGGTGLGLSIVKHIVDAHGGNVHVETALNHGSTFTLTLPIGNPTATTE